MGETPQCMKCKHYQATYDPLLPRGCKLFGIKSKTFPSLLVKQQTGEECEGYEPRRASEKKLDLNDPDLW